MIINYRLSTHSFTLIFLNLYFLCHIVYCNENCLSLSSDCCWHENNSSRSWKYHDHIDPTYYRRTFRLGTLRAPPARGYYSSVLSEPYELSALESCDYCSGTGVVTVSIRHWASPVSLFQLCWRQQADNRSVSQCKELDSNKHGLVETQAIRVIQGYPVNIVIVLRSRSVHLPPTGLIDFLNVQTEPCDTNLKLPKKEVKPRFYDESNDDPSIKRQRKIGRTAIQLPTESDKAVKNGVTKPPPLPAARFKSQGQFKSDPKYEQAKDDGIYEELLSKKRSYYDKLLEKQLLRKDFKTHQLAAPRVDIQSKNGSRPVGNNRVPPGRRILTTGWSKRKNDDSSGRDGTSGTNSGANGPTDTVGTNSATRNGVNGGVAIKSNGNDQNGAIGTVGTTTERNIEESRAKTTNNIPDPLSEMFGKDFAEFLEPTFNSSKYEKEEEFEDQDSLKSTKQRQQVENGPKVAASPISTTSATLLKSQNSEYSSNLGVFGQNEVTRPKSNLGQSGQLGHKGIENGIASKFGQDNQNEKRADHFSTTTQSLARADGGSAESRFSSQTEVSRGRNLGLEDSQDSRDTSLVGFGTKKNVLSTVNGKNSQLSQDTSTIFNEPRQPGLSTKPKDIDAERQPSPRLFQSTQKSSLVDSDEPTVTVFSPASHAFTTENPVALAKLKIHHLNEELTRDLANKLPNPLRVVPVDMNKHAMAHHHHVADVIPPHIHPAHSVPIVGAGARGTDDGAHGTGGTHGTNNAQNKGGTISTSSIQAKGGTHGTVDETGTDGTFGTLQNNAQRTQNLILEHKFKNHVDSTIGTHLVPRPQDGIIASNILTITTTSPLVHHTTTLRSENRFGTHGTQTHPHGTQTHPEAKFGPNSFQRITTTTYSPWWEATHEQDRMVLKTTTVPNFLIPNKFVVPVGPDANNAPQNLKNTVNLQNNDQKAPTVPKIDQDVPLVPQISESASRAPLAVISSTEPSWSHFKVPDAMVSKTDASGTLGTNDNDKECDFSGGCLFENGFCGFRNMNPTVFRKVNVAQSNFIETRVNPGQVASIESPTNATSRFFVVFDYLEWTEGERFMGCCQFKTNDKIQLRCPFESERRQGEVIWRGGTMECVEETEKIIFICENLGNKNGICALDNVRLHPISDPSFTEPCQREALNML
ncbi:unnamed protein product [Bursaphelenchus okinawaensis]|uniref:MAM domain-containing protein n=1 Tax=Bursaphelenchus okinawaensis TaxID=465554 RepID=A0A811K1V9_9BILA|nr:unnamed protein product [Bursaphelenchus okinawaensis]CAG9088991.1 unnamed protein product [Bursaphelenchus okinawaensis]